MANTIKILNSGVSSATPNSLEYGEIAINYNDGKLFYKDSSNAIVGSALISDNYVATLTAGTGVTISGGTGLGSSPTISIGQAVGTTDDVTFNTVVGTNGLTTLTTVGQPTSTPSDGTIAVDVTNNILYFMSGGTWQPVTAGGSGASVTSTDTPPSSPSAGDLWFETDTGNLFIYYNDGSSSQWVDIGGSSVANISVSDDAPQNPVNGDIWFETDTARTFVYYNDGTTGQWVEIGATAVAAVGIDGAIQFANNSTLAATPNFVWDDSNKRLGINTSTPSYSLDVTGSARITAGVIADLTGNADTASALQTARNIELTGDVTGTAAFDGSANIQISTTVANLTSNLNDLNDVDAASPSNGDFLRFDGSNWINDAVNLSTDTIGDYVDSLVAGTGVTITDNSGEAATPTIAIGQDVGTTADVIFNTVTADLTGNADTASALQTARTIELTGDVTGSASFDGSADITISATVTGEVTALNDLSDVTAATPSDGEFLQFNGSEWVASTYPTSEPMGHEDKTESTISFDSGSLTFSIAPVADSFTIWCKGVRHIKTTTQSVTIPNTAGLHYISFDENGAIQYELSYFEWHNDTPTAYVYWNGTDYILFDERHGITLDWQTHEYLHRTRGAVIANGFGASNYVEDGDGSSDTHAQIDIANGTFFDEDLQVDITHSATPTANTFEQILQGAAEMPVLYRSGSVWTYDTATEYPFKQGSALPTYNLNTAGTWSTPDIGNSKFGVSWIAATNIIGSPVVVIMGQDQYNNIGEAEAATWDGLNLTDFPVVEMRPLYKVAYQVASGYSNTPKAAIRGVYDLRRLGSGSSSIPAFPVADHGSLTGLSDDDHPQYLTEARHSAIDHSGVMSSVVLDDISNVNASSPTNGDFLRFDGSSWINDAVNLSSDTVGDYVQNLVAGTGVTITDNSGEAATPSISIGQDVSTTANVTFNTVNADLTGNVIGNADTASALQTARNIELTGDVTGSALFNGSADITISATVAADSVALGTDTTGDYVQNLVAGTGVTLADNSGESATPTISIGQDVSTTSNVTFANVNSDLVGSVTGDIYASNGTSKILENGTDGTNAAFLGNVTGTVSDISNHNLGNLGDVNFTFVTPAQGDIVYFDGSEWINVPYNLDSSGDVVLSSVQDGQYLRYDAGSGEWQNDFIDLGTDTVGDYVQNLVAGTGITLINNSGEGATPSISIGQDVATTANVTFNDLIVTGDLTVQGNTTSLETATLQVEDNIVVLNYGQASPVLDAGIQVDRGSGTDVTLRWNESLDYWDFTNDGTTYYKLITQLDDVSDVDLSSNAPVSGDLLKFDGSNWVPDALNLGADTTGDYVQNLVAGTGVTITNNSGESATPNIAIGQDVATTADVTFNTVTGTNGVVTLTSSGTPSASLADGAIAIDTANNILYFRSGSAWQQVSGGVEIGDAPPSSANEGDLWWESDTGRLKVYYNDGTSTQWVDAFTSGAGTSSSGSSSLLWTQFYYDGGVGPSGSTTGTLGENHGTWYEATAANYANTGLGSNNSADDPTLSGITYNSGTGRFTGFSQGVYQVSFTGNVAIDATGLTISQQKGVDISGNGIFVDFPINIMPEAAYHSYPNFETGFSMSTTVVMHDSNTANNYIEVSAGTQNTWYYAYYGYLSITKIG